MHGAASFAAFVVMCIGCTAEDVNGTGLESSPVTVDGGVKIQGDPPVCGSTPPTKRADPNSLPTCCSKGPARCVPGADVAPAGREKFASCGSGGYCVPEVFLTDPNRPLTRCKSMNDVDGACSSLCIPDVGKYESMLPQSVCAASERCVPCISPLDGKPTGACDPPAAAPGCNAAADGGAATTPSSTTPPSTEPMRDCCHGRGFSVGKCVPRSNVPAEQLSHLRPDVCGAADVCVPSEMMASDFVPLTCAVPGLLGYAGVCMSACLDFGISGIFLSQGSCDAVHLCVPCRDLAGAPTGAPGCN